MIFKDRGKWDFLKMRKKSAVRKILNVWCFLSWLDQFFFSPKKFIFAFLNPKIKDNFQKIIKRKAQGVPQ